MSKNVSLCDVIRRANTKVDKDNTYLEYYIGGDHFDSGEVRVKKHGLIAGSTIGPMFYYGFRAGQFLLVSRNPHLKKAGIVDIDGICSEKTFVLETIDPEVLLPEYLPFVLQNDRFWDYAMMHGHGSTNKFLNWSDLAQYQFELPEIGEQKKVADLLWSIERTKDAYKAYIEKSDELVKSQFVEMFGIPEFNIHDFPVSTIGDLCSDVHYGTSSKAGDEGKYICLRMNNMTYGGEIDLTDVKYIDLPDKELDGCLVKKGDVLFNRTNSKELVGKTCAFMLESPMVIAGYIIRLRMNGKVTANYLSTYMNLPSSKKLLLSMAKGAVGQANINAQEVKSITVLVPPMDKQLEFEQLLSQTDKSKLAAKQAVVSLNALQKSLMRKNLE